MVGLFAMCRLFSDYTKFGYDWGGSVTAEPADKNPDRIVYTCCHSLACTCPVKGARVEWNVHGCCYAPISPDRPNCWCGKNGDAIKFGGVNWSRPESVAGSVRSAASHSPSPLARMCVFVGYLAQSIAIHCHSGRAYM